MSDIMKYVSGIRRASLGNSTPDLYGLKKMANDNFNSYARFITLSFKGQCLTSDTILYEDLINYLKVNLEGDFMWCFEFYSDLTNYHAHGIWQTNKDANIRKLCRKWCELQGIKYNSCMLKVEKCRSVENTINYCLKHYEIMKKLEKEPIVRFSQWLKITPIPNRVLGDEEFINKNI